MKIHNVFTLVELLVVIAIISILAALLLPTLMNAQQQALVAACTSNLRQQFIGFSSYSADFEDLLPNTPSHRHAAQRIGRGADDSAWTYQTYAAMYLEIPTKSATSSNPDYQDFIRTGATTDILLCPSVNPGNFKGYSYDGNSSRGAIAYRVSLGYGSYPNTTAPTIPPRHFRFSRFGRVAPASELALVADNLFGEGTSATAEKLRKSLTCHDAVSGNVLTGAGSVHYEQRFIGFAKQPLHTAESIIYANGKYYVMQSANVGKAQWMLPNNAGSMDTGRSPNGCPFF